MALKGLQPGSLSIISSHCMETILKNNSHGVITQLHFIQMQPSTVSNTPLDLSFRCTLQMPDFSKLFTLESDSCDNGLGVVLFQDEHPMAFTGKSLPGNNLSTSTYEKEMMTILHAVHKWWPYLFENPSCIKANHQSLKYFLEQWVSSPTQQKWVSKLKDDDYKKARDNLMVDALFHTFDAHVSLSVIFMPIPTWLHSVQQGHVNDSSLSEIIQPLASNPSVVPYFSWDGSKFEIQGSSGASPEHRY